MSRFYERGEFGRLAPHIRFFSDQAMRARYEAYWPGCHGVPAKVWGIGREFRRFQPEQHATQWWMPDGRVFRSDHWSVPH